MLCVDFYHFANSVGSVTRLKLICHMNGTRSLLGPIVSRPPEIFSQIGEFTSRGYPLLSTYSFKSFEKNHLPEGYEYLKADAVFAVFLYFSTFANTVSMVTWTKSQVLHVICEGLQGSCGRIYYCSCECFRILQSAYRLGF